MSVFPLSNPLESRRKLSQSVIQITQLMNMYHAELARILGLQCGDIGELANGKATIECNTHAWEQAVQFVRMYQLLYKKFEGNGIAMYHWLRTDCPELGCSPHLAMVDHHRLPDILAMLAPDKL